MQVISMKKLFLLFFALHLAFPTKAELFIYTKQLPNISIKVPKLNVKNRGFKSFIYKEVPELSAGEHQKLVDILPELVPSKDWLIRVDEGTEDMMITWAGGLHWFEVLEAIDAQTDANILISHDHKVIAVSKSEELLPYLAYREPKVWRLKETISLKQNISNWLAMIEWELDWRLEKDFPVIHSAVLTGELIGSENNIGQLAYVLEQVNENAKSDMQIGYDFREGNKVVVIYEKAKTISKIVKNRGF